MKRCLRCGAPLKGEATREEVTLAKPPAPYASGDRVGEKYLVLENFGAGPLGTTYRARDPDGRTVALKVVAPGLFADEGERQRFLEGYGQLKGRQFERSSAPIDMGIDEGGVLYVVSRWVYGASLRRILRAWKAADRKLERDQVLGVLQGCAAALRELHTVSSHGAVYPENIHVTVDSVVLTDPGLAAAVVPARFAGHLERFPEVLPFVAPEVRAAKRSNAGADLHGLGALASELLFGDPAQTANPAFSAADLGDDVAEALRGLVALQPARRAGALPQLLERLARVAGEASLPPYAPLPRPAAMTDARTRRVPTLPRKAPPPITAAKGAVKTSPVLRARGSAAAAIEVSVDEAATTVPLDKG